MYDSLNILLVTSGTIGIFHTMMGPDHYLPLIVMSRSGQWSSKKTILITVLCGFGHIISSIVLAVIVILLGLTAMNLELIESARSMIAGWAMITFGLVYMIWGLKRALKNKEHIHHHLHVDGKLHEHKHIHTGNHAHFHEETNKNVMTPWILFLIFVLGPCEPLIPLIMYPTLNNDIPGAIMVAVIFTVMTLITMLGIIIISFYGINKLPYNRLEKHTHAIAGLTILLCGIGIQFLGL